MFNEFEELEKCKIANKVTLAGYALLASTPIFGTIEYLTEIPPAITSLPPALYGYLALEITGYGKDTFEKYQETKEYIEKFDKIPENFLEKTNKTYCHRKGVELALKEKGLESLLEKPKSKNHQT